LAEAPAAITIIAEFARFTRFAGPADDEVLYPTQFQQFASGEPFAPTNGQSTMACRIDRLPAEGDFVVLRISGRITQDDVTVLRAAIEQERSALAIDLAAVGLVDRDAVTFLAFSEARGIELRNCPPYIREWVDRERAEPPRDSSDPRRDE
jgi:hypothetical protein